MDRFDLFVRIVLVGCVIGLVLLGIIGVREVFIPHFFGSPVDRDIVVVCDQEIEMGLVHYQDAWKWLDSKEYQRLCIGE